MWGVTPEPGKVTTDWVPVDSLQMKHADSHPASRPLIRVQPLVVPDADGDGGLPGYDGYGLFVRKKDGLEDRTRAVERHRNTADRCYRPQMSR